MLSAAGGPGCDDGGTLELRPAPMAGVTNAPFRPVARQGGAGLATGGEIDARALLADNERTRVLARYLPEERPIAFQLPGDEPDVGKGQGAALMRGRAGGQRGPGGTGANDGDPHGARRLRILPPGVRGSASTTVNSTGTL